MRKSGKGPLSALTLAALFAQVDLAIGHHVTKLKKVYHRHATSMVGKDEFMEWKPFLEIIEASRLLTDTFHLREARTLSRMRLPLCEFLMSSRRQLLH